MEVGPPGQAARIIIGQLEERDYLSVIAFDENVDIVQQSRRKTEGKKLITKLEAIDVAGGSIGHHGHEVSVTHA